VTNHNAMRVHEYKFIPNITKYQLSFNSETKDSK